MQTTTLTISGMTCNHCVQSVTSALQELAGVDTVTVSLDTGSASVTHSPEKVNPQALRQAVQEIGFEVT